MRRNWLVQDARHKVPGPLTRHEPEMMTKSLRSDAVLTDLPNIGKEVARLLASADVRSPQELRRVGSVAAAGRIKNIRPDDPPCRSMLAGLEGAIRGVRWHTIPKAEREALWDEYAARISPCPARAGGTRPGTSSSRAGR